MSRSAEDNVVKLVISPDRMVAQIVVADAEQRSGLSAVMICAVAEARGIKITAEVSKEIERILEIAETTTEEFTHTLSKGTEPKHGSAGKFELSEALQEAERLRTAARNRHISDAESPATTDDDDEALCHYNRSTLQIVRKGESIGKILPPRPGVDGVDALGRSVAANNPKPFVPEPSPDIRVEDDFTVTALRGGLLEVDGNIIKVISPLVITGAVDFSVGNVDFPGSVEIAGGVKDRFRVRAEEDITVADVAEAAEIHAGRDLNLDRGMTARGKGSFSAGRDAKIMYIDSATGTVGRHLQVMREIKNSKLTLQGELRANGARVAGGKIIAGGAIELAIAGVEAGTATALSTGRHTRLEELLRSAAETHTALLECIEDITAKLEVLKNRQKLTGDEIEELTLLNMQISDRTKQEARLAKALASGVELLVKHTEQRISILKRIFPGTVLQIGLYRAEINRVTQGPLTISLSSDGNPQVQIGEAPPVPLSSIAKVKRDETLCDFSAYLPDDNREETNKERLAA